MQLCLVYKDGLFYSRCFPCEEGHQLFDLLQFYMYICTIVTVLHVYLHNFYK